jgi:hypothetical protein
MNYLLGLLIVGATTALFLRVLAVLERRGWPSEGMDSPSKVLLALVLRRRVS